MWEKNYKSFQQRFQSRCNGSYFINKYTIPQREDCPRLPRDRARIVVCMSSVPPGNSDISISTVTQLCFIQSLHFSFLVKHQRALHVCYGILFKLKLISKNSGCLPSTKVYFFIYKFFSLFNV